MEITKNFNLSLKDYVKFNILFTKMARNLLFYFLVLGVIIILLFGYKDFSKLVTINFWLNWGLYFLVGSLVLTLHFVIVIYFSTKSVYRKNPDNFTNLNLTITSVGLSQTLRDGNVVSIDWKGIYKITNGFGLYIFLLDKNQGVIINKNNYSQEERKTIEAYIKNR